MPARSYRRDKLKPTAHYFSTTSKNRVYAREGDKRHPAYKRAVKLEHALARKYPGLFSKPIPPHARREFAAVMRAWQRAHFYSWADNYRSAIERSERASARDTRPRRDSRNRYSFYEKGVEELRGGYTVAWRPHGAGVVWYLRSPNKRVVAHGTARQGDDAISSARYALSNEMSGHHGSQESRGHTYNTSRETRRYSAMRPKRDKRRHHHRSAGAPSFKKQAKISRKIRLLRKEGYPPAQAAAIAYRMYGENRPLRRIRHR